MSDLLPVKLKHIEQNLIGERSADNVLEYLEFQAKAGTPIHELVLLAENRDPQLSHEVVDVLLKHKLNEWGLLEAFYNSLREHWHRYHGHGVMTYHHLEETLKKSPPSSVAIRKNVQWILKHKHTENAFWIRRIEEHLQKHQFIAAWKDVDRARTGHTFYRNKKELWIYPADLSTLRQQTNLLYEAMVKKSLLAPLPEYLPPFEINLKRRGVEVRSKDSSNRLIHSSSCKWGVKFGKMLLPVDRYTAYRVLIIADHFKANRPKLSIE
jgi:hypothetical protein